MGGLMWHMAASGRWYYTRSITLSFELTGFPLDSHNVGTQVCSVMDHIPQLHSDRTHMTINVQCTLTTTNSKQHINCDMMFKRIMFIQEIATLSSSIPAFLTLVSSFFVVHFELPLHSNIFALKILHLESNTKLISSSTTSTNIWDHFNLTK